MVLVLEKFHLILQENNLLIVFLFKLLVDFLELRVLDGEGVLVYGLGSLYHEFRVLLLQLGHLVHLYFVFVLLLGNTRVQFFNLGGVLLLKIDHFELQRLQIVDAATWRR